MDTDLLVVGAGPVGLSAAVFLKRHGARVRIIDKNPEPVRLTKAAGIWSRTTEVLEQAGLSDAFLEAGTRAHGASIFADGRRIVHVSLDQIDSPFNFILMLPQDRSEALLAEHLKSAGLEVERGLELQELSQDPESVTCRTSGPTIRARWVVGCDGAHSTVRHLLNLGFDGRAEPHHWMVGDVAIDGPLPEDEVLVHLHQNGPLAMFPLGNHRFRVVGEVSEPGKDRPELSDMQALLDERGPARVSLQDPHGLGYFRIHERQVTSYRVGRVFLAGDAAHIHSPLGGQGMNTGVQDAHNLAWKLAMVADGRLRPEVLDSYHQERHPVAAGVLKGTSIGTHMITLRSPLAQSLRNRLMSVVANLEPFQRIVRGVASEIDIHYHQSPLSQESPGTRLRRGPRAGDRAPDARLFRPGSSEPCRLFDLFADTKFVLLLLGKGPGLAELAGWVNAHLTSLVAPHLIVPGSEPPETFPAPVLLDSMEEVHHRYAVSGDALYLVRPDGYVAHRSQPADLKQLQDYLDQLVTARPVA